MSENDLRTDVGDGLPAEEPDPSFDERAFLRRVRLKSIVRAVAIAAVVVAVSWAAVVLGMIRWEGLTWREANRIDSYYNDFVVLSNPNTWVLGQSVTRFHFPGASNDYTTYRLVGGRPVPAGVRSVDFSLWDDEFLRGFDERLTTVGPRVFSGSEVVPELRMLHPGALDDTYVNEMGIERGILDEFEAITAESLERLAATPPSYTAEVAFSFDRTLTRAEIESFAASGTTLAWGAVSSWEPEDMPMLPLINAGSQLGIPFAQPGISYGAFGFTSTDDAEDSLIDALRLIADNSRLPAAGRARSVIEQLERDGVSYYGAVLTGSPDVLMRLAGDPRVTAVCFGLSVGPWE
jgi:hypothetical protein